MTAHRAGGGVVTDPRLDKLFASLEASFEAAVARDEHVAAADLALSFQQDRDLRESLALDGGVLRIAGGVAAPVVEVGRDYARAVAPTVTLVPLQRAVTTIGGAVPPATTDRSLVETLRGWARGGVSVQVCTPIESFNGRLSIVGPDHVIVHPAVGPVAVPLAVVERISLLRGRLPDDF